MRKKKNKKPNPTHTLLKSQAVYAETHPRVVSAVLIILYFIMDAGMLNVAENAHDGLSIFCILFTLLLFYHLYVAGYQIGINHTAAKDIPAFIRNKRKYVFAMFHILILLTIGIALGYDEIITRWMPNLDAVYYPSQVFVLVLIAPVIEELAFRYFLYDKWAKPAYGLWKGLLISGILFVICHPVTDLNGMILYWMPTILFYLMYESFGLYGSILAHIVFNFIAL